MRHSGFLLLLMPSYGTIRYRVNSFEHSRWEQHFGEVSTVEFASVTSALHTGVE